MRGPAAIHLADPELRETSGPRGPFGRPRGGPAPSSSNASGPAPDPERDDRAAPQVLDLRVVHLLREPLLYELLREPLLPELLRELLGVE